MKAQRLDVPAPAERMPLRSVDLPAPRPGPGEVSIAVEACGVCRTDLHVLEGEVAARLPIVPGHQASGRVVEIGEGVTGFAAGDAVGVGWMASTCRQCAFCLSGRENLCALATFTGRDRDGGYADLLTARAEWIYRLPHGLSALESAPLLCAGIIGYRSLRVSGIQPGGRLGLFGFGASAHLAIQVARHWGCAVYAFTREAVHRDLALRMGAAWSGDTFEDPGIALDAAVTFAPAGEVVVAALERLERGATVAVNAIHMSPIPSFGYEMLYGERAVRSVTNSTRRDAEEFLELAARIPVRAETEAFPLGDAGQALLRVKRGEVRGAAVLEIGAFTGRKLPPPA
ncbi:MAG TPA: zinc-dependent alcohol dehydrogenase family protein [Thermoanaerobaculia bacterium]|nr:zinc-dependent alcohol dehydrogenase family protein [Thermoanaerobaculia bacterium]